MSMTPGGPADGPEYLDGSGPAFLEPPKLDEWPDVNWTPDAAAKRVDLMVANDVSAADAGAIA